MEVIKVENVWKKFRIPTEKRNTVFEKLASLVSNTKPTYREFWALRDISFSVNKGEVFGIIGRNGSGKSTLLRTISGIMVPDQGKVTVKGSLSPLLSLGVGFKPELTAEDNVHLYGSILGIRDNNLSVDEIFDFAELQKFRKMKLKNFSSGMYIRLAFSTAVAVDPDILLIDEILAVGDEEFQKKCMDKIYEFKRSRKTIIFVSHALDAIKGLCDRSILLDSGEIKLVGSTEKVINDYLSDIREKEEEKLIAEHRKLHDEVVVQEPESKSIEEIAQEPEKPIDRWGSREIEITEVKFLNKSGKETFIFKTGETMIVRIKYNAKQRIEKPVFGIAIHRNDGTHITGPNTKVHNQVIDHVEGEGEIEYIIDSLPLLEGTYLFTAGVFDYMCVVPYDYHNMRFTFKVAKGDVKNYGIFYIPCRWRYR